MMITSLSFAYLQVSSNSAAGTAAAQPAAAAPVPAPQSVAQDECRGHCDTPRRSPLFRALKDALMELAQAAKPAAGTPPSSAASTDTAAATAGTTATNQTPADAEASPDLEVALMAFARTLMQVMRDEFAGRRERTQGDDDGHGHRHHRHHSHHGHARWGDPAQRVEALAQQVAASAPTSTAPAVAATTTSSAGDVTTEPVKPDAAKVDTTPAAVATTAGPSSTVIFVASIQIQQAEASPAQASPFANVHQRLLDAFAALQKAMGKPEASDGDAQRNELATFLQALSARLRGEDTATAEAATQPGALLSIAA